jgi:hypothetical protein
VTYASLLNLAQTVRPGQVVAYDANVKFSTNVPGIGSVSLPLSKKGELPVPTIPKVSIGSVDWGNISLTNTTATINLNVTNLNDFAVTMKKLNYDFAIGGQSVLNSQVTKALKFENGQQQTIQIPVSFKATSLGLGVHNTYHCLRPECAVASFLHHSRTHHDLKWVKSITVIFTHIDLNLPCHTNIPSPR